MKAVLIAALLAAAPALAKEVDLDRQCEGEQRFPKKAPQFEDFAAEVERIARPAEPKLVDKDAQLYRSAIRQAARKGEVFAGHYRVALLGCGAGCTGLAIINSKTGQVSFDDEVRTVVDRAYNPFDRITFRPDSRLMVISGAPNEDARRNGIAFYEWTGQRLVILKRYTYEQVCKRRR